MGMYVQGDPEVIFAAAAGTPMPRAMAPMPGVGTPTGESTASRMIRSIINRASQSVRGAPRAPRVLPVGEIMWSDGVEWALLQLLVGSTPSHLEGQDSHQVISEVLDKRAAWVAGS